MLEGRWKNDGVGYFYNLYRNSKKFYRNTLNTDDYCLTQNTVSKGRANDHREE